MRNFELRIADQRVVLSVKWLQTRSRSRTHSSANPRANNTPKSKNILRRRHRTPQTRQQQTTLQPPKSARADRTSGARSTLRAFTKHPSHGRTTCEAARRCPKPPRRANAPQRRPETTHAARHSRAHRDEHAFRLHRWSLAASHPRRPTSSQCSRSGAPKQPTNHEGAARAASHAHSDSIGGVAPCIPTPAGLLRARNLDKRLCVESYEPPSRRAQKKVVPVAPRWARRKPNFDEPRNISRTHTLVPFIVVNDGEPYWQVRTPKISLRSLRPLRLGGSNSGSRLTSGTTLAYEVRCGTATAPISQPVTARGNNRSAISRARNTSCRWGMRRFGSRSCTPARSGSLTRTRRSWPARLRRMERPSNPHSRCSGWRRPNPQQRLASDCRRRSTGQWRDCNLWSRRGIRGCRRTGR